MFILFCNFFSTFVIFLLHAPCGNQLRLTGSAWVNKVLYLYNSTQRSQQEHHHRKKLQLLRESDCPLQGECQTKALIYQVVVTNKATKEVQTYAGLTENTFKSRYLSHTSYFRNKTKRNATELSKHIWKLKDSNTSYTINWKIIKKSQPYSNKTKRCNLCMSEKFIIICHPELSSLNKRNELISTCRHRKKFLLR